MIKVDFRAVSSRDLDASEGLGESEARSSCNLYTVVGTLTITVGLELLEELSFDLFLGVQYGLERLGKSSLAKNTALKGDSLTDCTVVVGPH